MVIKGVYEYDGKSEIYPDIGYSFCNCKNLFYTNYSNLNKHGNGLHEVEKPLEWIKNEFDVANTKDIMMVTMPDVFFVEWHKNPYSFGYWNPRAIHTLWDMEQLALEFKNVGFEIIDKKRIMDVHSSEQKHFMIVVMKP